MYVGLGDEGHLAIVYWLLPTNEILWIFHKRAEWSLGGVCAWAEWSLGGVCALNCSLHVQSQSTKQWDRKRSFLIKALVKACQKLTMSFKVAHIYLSISLFLENKLVHYPSIQITGPMAILILSMLPKNEVKTDIALFCENKKTQSCIE